MKTLIVKEKNQLEIQEVPVPRISSKQALVKTVACGICGTDATIIDQSFKGLPQFPLMLGHEGVGEIVEIGTEVTTFHVGDFVILPFTGEVETKEGKLQSGWGAFSEYGVVDDAAAYSTDSPGPDVALAQKKLPSTISRKEAPMIVTLREVFSSILYFGIQPQDSVVIYGSGPVAITFLKLLLLIGIKDVIAVVRNDTKVQLLRELGVPHIINSSEGSVQEQVRELFPQGVHYVLDAVGSEHVINEGITLLRDRGEVLCYGVPKTNSMKFDWTSAPYNWKINFQQMPYKDEEGQCHNQVIKWVESGELKLSDFISDYYVFDDILLAFDDYLSGKTLKKVIITYN